MAPETAGAYLALRAAGRQWALKSWVEHYGVAPDEWPDLREVVRGVVAAGPVPPQAVADELAGSPRFAHLAKEFAEPNHTFLKPFAWQGDIALGPDLGGPLTLQSPAAASAWGGVPDLDDAGRFAVLDYLAGYGPASPEHVHYWLGEGLSAGRARIARWWREVEDQVVEVDVDGERRWHLAEHAADLADVRPEVQVHLLPGKDDWVMGPGTKDTWVVPPTHRAAMTRGANPVVVDGVVSGTWRRDGDVVLVDCVLEGGARSALMGEVDRLGALLGTGLGAQNPVRQYGGSLRSAIAANRRTASSAPSTRPARRRAVTVTPPR